MRLLQTCADHSSHVLFQLHPRRPPASSSSSLLAAQLVFSCTLDKIVSRHSFLKSILLTAQGMMCGVSSWAGSTRQFPLVVQIPSHFCNLKKVTYAWLVTHVREILVAVSQHSALLGCTWGNALTIEDKWLLQTYSQCLSMFDFAPSLLSAAWKVACASFCTFFFAAGDEKNVSLFP